MCCRWVGIPFLLIFLTFHSSFLRGEQFPAGEVIREVLLLLEREHMDAGHFSPGNLLEGALENISEAYPEVTVKSRFRSHAIEIELEASGRSFHAGGARSVTLREMGRLLAGIHSFLSETLHRPNSSKESLFLLVNGLLSRVDPWSQMLDEEDYADFRRSLTGRNGGLGLVLSSRNDHLIIKEARPDGPAHKAGLRPGDHIVAIGNDSAAWLTPKEAYRLIQGEPGTEVGLLVEQSGGGHIRRHLLTRREFHRPSIFSRKFQAGPESWVGYLKIIEFQHTTGTELISHVNLLHPDAAGFMGLILDLRGNPGGVLEEAIRVADKFLDRGAIVTLVRGEGEQEIIHARGYGSLRGIPLIVLVDGRSASGAEIVAGALQDNRRAILLGGRTAGKGSVQSMIPLRSGYGLKLTVARYLTPGGRAVQSVGISPEIQLLPAHITGEGEGIRLYLTRQESSTVAGIQPSGPLRGGSALARLQYFAEPGRGPPGQDPSMPAAGPNEPVELQGDYPVSLAREILFTNNKRDFSGLLRNTLEVLRVENIRQNRLISRALEDLDIDWKEGNSKAGGQVAIREIMLHTRKSPRHPWVVPQKGIVAGEQTRISITVENTGTMPVHRLIGRTKSEAPYLDRVELPIGGLKPGERKSASAVIQLPGNLPEGLEHLTIDVLDGGNRIHQRGSLMIPQRKRASPELRVTVALRDDQSKGSPNNGDGLLQSGEVLNATVKITNVGAAASGAGTLVIRNWPEYHPSSPSTQADFSPIQPGAGRTLHLTIPLPRDNKSASIPLTFQALDYSFPELALKKVVWLPLGRKLPEITMENPKIKFETSTVKGMKAGVILSGSVEDRDGVLLVNIRLNGGRIYRNIRGEPTPPNTLPFRLEVPLREGRNILEIEAMDGGRLLEQRQLVLWRGDRVEIAGERGIRASW